MSLQSIQNKSHMPLIKISQKECKLSVSPDLFHHKVLKGWGEKDYSGHIFKMSAYNGEHESDLI